MNTRKRLLSLVGSGALLLGLLVGTTGTVFADGQVEWTGNGQTDGVPNDIQCDESNTPYLYWVFVPGGQDAVTAATITFGGTGSGTYPLNQDNGQWKLQNGPWFDLDGLTAIVDYTGTLGNGNALVTISHGCPGETEESAPPSFEQSQEVETDEPSSPPETDEPSSPPETDAPSFFTSQEAETDAPSEPDTATIGGSKNVGSPADGAWLLVVALGVLLASIVVLTPARAKAPRR
jgi:hypothetical protein